MKTSRFYKRLYETGLEANKEAVKQNMTLTEFLIYGCIYFNSSSNVTEINRETNINRTTISKALKKMVEKDIVKRIQSKEDKREFKYEIKK